MDLFRSIYCHPFVSICNVKTFCEMFGTKLLISAVWLVFPFAVYSNQAVYNNQIGSRKTDQTSTNSKKGNELDYMKQWFVSSAFQV